MADRLFIPWFDLVAFSQIEFRDAELPPELAEFFQVDQAENVDYGEFRRVGGDDGQPDDIVSLIFQVNVDVLPATTTADADDLIPSRLTQLRADRFEIAR